MHSDENFNKGGLLEITWISEYFFVQMNQEQTNKCSLKNVFVT